jgi:hypothetical protein
MNSLFNLLNKWRLLALNHLNGIKQIIDVVCIPVLIDDFINALRWLVRVNILAALCPFNDYNFLLVSRTFFIWNWRLNTDIGYWMRVFVKFIFLCFFLIIFSLNILVNVMFSPLVSYIAHILLSIIYREILVCF